MGYGETSLQSELLIHTPPSHVHIRNSKDAGQEADKASVKEEAPWTLEGLFLVFIIIFLFVVIVFVILVVSLFVFVVILVFKVSFLILVHIVLISLEGKTPQVTWCVEMITNEDALDTLTPSILISIRLTVIGTIPADR
ncbi:hypothetical protein TSMEX_004848 [Taenia solium]|eukprot:TsM_000918000 transcript=TsM_000918000 gene=TsM_000918000